MFVHVVLKPFHVGFEQVISFLQRRQPSFVVFRPTTQVFLFLFRCGGRGRFSFALGVVFALFALRRLRLLNKIKHELYIIIIPSGTRVILKITLQIKLLIITIYKQLIFIKKKINSLRGVSCTPYPRGLAPLSEVSNVILVTRT